VLLAAIEGDKHPHVLNFSLSTPKRNAMQQRIVDEGLTGWNAAESARKRQDAKMNDIECGCHRVTKT